MRSDGMRSCVFSWLAMQISDISRLRSNLIRFGVKRRRLRNPFKSSPNLRLSREILGRVK